MRRKRYSTTIKLLVSCIICCLVYNFTTVKGVPGLTYTQGEQIIVEELLVYDGYFIDTLYSYFFNEGSIIEYSVGNLPQSNSTVKFWVNLEFQDVWDPAPINYTLAPGEFSNSVECELIDGLWEHELGTLMYGTYLLTEGSNATVQMWFEIIYSAKPDNGFIGIDFLFIGGTFLLSIMTLVLITKRKSKKKNE